MLYDEIRVGLADPERRFKGEWDKRDPTARAAFKRLSEKIDAAQRFTLEDDFVRIVQASALIEPAGLLALFKRARPAYDLMWVEWSPRSRFNVTIEWAAARKMKVGDRPIDGKAGILAERQGDDLYHVSFFGSRADQPMLTGWPFGVRWSPSGEGIESTITKADAAIKELHKSVEPAPGTFAFGVPWLTAYAKGIENNGGGKMTIHLTEDQLRLYEFAAHGTTMTAVSPFAHETMRIIKALRARGNYNPRPLSALCEEGSGDFRWIAALFGVMALRAPDMSEHRSLPNARPDRVVWGKRVPFLEYRTLRITLPGTIKETGEHHASDDPIRKKQHDVRGHVRVYHRDDPARRHETLVREHKRGDPALGIIVKDYRVRAAPVERGGKEPND